MGLIPNFGRGRKSDGKGKSMIARPDPQLFNEFTRKDSVRV